MTAPGETNDDATQAGSTREGDVGDVETAGETTAAATAGGNTTVEKPVGAETLVKVADTPDAAGREED